MIHALAIFLGGGAGAVARHGVNGLAFRAFGSGFPVGTLTVNVVGSLLMGLLIGVLAARSQGDELVRLAVATGFLGGFTTFSAFSLDALTLWQRGESAAAAGYVFASVGLSLAAVVAGFALSRSLI
ncbi:MAG: fluoride efflux transporter CrcB [Pseudomonadota bacterium]